MCFTGKRLVYNATLRSNWHHQRHNSSPSSRSSSSFLFMGGFSLTRYIEVRRRNQSIKSTASASSFLRTVTSVAKTRLLATAHSGEIRFLNSSAWAPTYGGRNTSSVAFNSLFEYFILYSLFDRIAQDYLFITTFHTNK